MKQKLTIAQIRDISLAFSICRQLPIGTQFRYAIAKNQPELKRELEAVAQALPEPDLSPLREECRAAEAALQTACQTLSSDPQKLAEARATRDAALAAAQSKHAAALSLHHTWQLEFEKFMGNTVEIDLHTIPLSALGELNDLATYPPGHCLNPLTGQPVPEHELPIPAEADTAPRLAYYTAAARAACDTARARQNARLIEALAPLIQP